MKARLGIAILVHFGLLGLSGPLVFAAEPFPEFTFKRVKPPASGTTRRITIQITPEAAKPVVAIEPVSAPATGDAGSSDYAWFWAGVSPDLAESGPGRFALALRQLAGAPATAEAAVPRLEHLRAIAEAHGTEILLATIGKKVSPALVLAMIAAESSGRSDAESPAGAQGLMQLMPDTAKRFGVEDPLDAGQNIRGGVAYLDWLLTRFNGDPIFALAGYNAGENAVTGHDGVPSFAETRAYVPKVIAAFQVARALCMTPPELYSDGCVFDLRKSK